MPILGLTPRNRNIQALHGTEPAMCSSSQREHLEGGGLSRLKATPLLDSPTLSGVRQAQKGMLRTVVMHLVDACQVRKKAHQTVCLQLWIGDLADKLNQGLCNKHIGVWD